MKQNIKRGSIAIIIAIAILVIEMLILSTAPLAGVHTGNSILASLLLITISIYVLYPKNLLKIGFGWKIIAFQFSIFLLAQFPSTYYYHWIYVPGCENGIFDCYERVNFLSKASNSLATIILIATCIGVWLKRPPNELAMEQADQVLDREASK